MNIEFQDGDKPPVVVDGNNVIITYKWCTVVLPMSVIDRVMAIRGENAGVVARDAAGATKKSRSRKKEC